MRAYIVGRAGEDSLLKFGTETFLDGSFARQKKGLCRREKKRGKGTGKWMVLVDASRSPVGSSAGKASPP